MKPHIHFYEKNGSLIIKISVHGQGRGIYDTGITIDPAQWDQEKEQCETYEINRWMLDTRNSLMRSFRPDMKPKRLWTSFVNNQTESKATIKDCFEYYTSNMELKDSSKAVYVSISKALLHAGIYETPITEVSPALIRSFINSLKTKSSSKFNTMVRIKAALTRYVRDHSLDMSWDFEGIAPKPKYVPKQDQWLTLIEVQKLLDAPLRFVKKDARDLFCLSCFSGMSISDVLAFDPKKNMKEFNGREFIVYNRQKTGSQCRVPIVAQARAIIDSRQSWPVKINLRTLQYQINNTLSNIVGRKLNSHKGRKTFGALMLDFGFSIESTSKMLGHSNIIISSRLYAPITSQKIENEMSSITSNGLAIFT